MRTLFQSTATDRMVFMVDETDHVTGLAGLTLTITHSKAGAAFASMTVTVTDRGSGWYSLAFTSTHTDTIGDLALHITATGADSSDVLFQVVSAVRGLAGTALPNAAADAAGGLPISDAGGLDLDAKIGALTFGTANRVNAQVYGMEAGTVTAASIDDGAFTAAKFASGAFDAVWTVATRSLTTFGTLIADIYTYFTSSSRQDTFKATGFATPTNVTDARDAILAEGAASWTTATGFSTHSAADVVTAMGTGTFLTAIPWNASWDTEVESEVTDALTAFSWSTTQVILTSTYDAAKTAATQTSVNTIDGVVDSIKATTDKLDTTLVLDGLVYQFTANALELAPTGGSAPSAADIYTYFTDSNREDAFKADVSGLALEATAQAILTDTAEIGVAGAGLTALASQTSVNDLPTNAEFEARTLPAASYFDPATDGVALRANGLDSVSTTEPTGVATNFREMVIASWMVNYAKNIKDGDAGTIIVYASNGSTVVTTQTYSVVGNVETVNRAT